MSIRYSYVKRPHAVNPVVKGPVLLELSMEARETAVPYDIVRFIDEGHPNKKNDLIVISRYLTAALKFTSIPNYRLIAPARTQQLRAAHGAYRIFQRQNNGSEPEESEIDTQIQQDLAKLADAAGRIPVPYDTQEFIDIDTQSGGARLEMSLMEFQIVKTFLATAKKVTGLQSYRKMKRMQHCVRCHRNYDAGENEVGACWIAHVFDYSRPQEMRIQDTVALANFNYPRSSSARGLGFTKIVNVYPSLCCGDSVVLHEDGPKNFINIAKIRFCFQGRHTANVSDLDDILNGPYNGENIVECERGEAGGMGLLGLECSMQPIEDDPILVGEDVKIEEKTLGETCDLSSPTNVRAGYPTLVMPVRNTKHW